MANEGSRGRDSRAFGTLGQCQASVFGVVVQVVLGIVNLRCQRVGVAVLQELDFVGSSLVGIDGTLQSVEVFLRGSVGLLLGRGDGGSQRGAGGRAGGHVAGCGYGIADARVFQCALGLQEQGVHGGSVDGRGIAVHTVKHVHARGREVEGQLRVDVDGRSHSQTLQVGLVGKGLREGDASRDVCGDFECLAQGRGEALCRSLSVAQGQRSLLAVPRSPAVHFALGARPGVAAHPVNVGQHVGVAFLPVDAVGNLLPERAGGVGVVGDGVGQVIVVVEFDHARAAGEGAAQFAHHARVVSVLCATELREDETVGHQRVDGAEGRVGHVVLVNEVVAVGDPLLAVGALVAHIVIVVLLSPYGIGELEPEGRSPGAHGGVEEHVGLDGADVALDADDALGIFNTRVAGVGTYGRELGRNAVELEEVEAVVSQHVGAGIDEGLVVGGVGELHAALSVPEGAAVATRSAVAAHGTEPGAEAAAHLLCHGVGFGEAVGEVGVEAPGAVFVPAVVPEEGLHLLAILVEEVGLPLLHDILALADSHVGRVVLGVVAVDVELIPRDVAGEGSPGHSTLAFAVGEE